MAGFNCSVGPVPLMNAVKKVSNKVNIPLIVQPNAGLPKEVDGRRIYMATPEYFGEYTKNFSKLVCRSCVLWNLSRTYKGNEPG